MNFDVIKKHPAATVGVVAIGCLFLFLLMSGGSSSGSATTDSSGIDPNAALAAATSLQTAEIQAGTELAGQQLAYKSNLAQIEGATNLATLSTQADLLKTYNNNDTALKVAGLGAQVQSKQIDATTTMQLANYKQLTDVAAIGAGVNIASIAANRDTSLAEISAMADANKYTAMLGAQTAQILSTNAANQNASNQKAATAQAGINAAGGILGTLGSIAKFFF